MAVVDLVLEALNCLLVLGGVVVQMPQIYKLASTKSVEGLSETAWIMQTFSTMFYCAYNFINDQPFMTWGDAFFAVVAYCVIVGMIWLYGKDRGALSEFKDNFRKFVVFCFLTTVILTVTKKSPAWFTTLMGLIPMPMVVAGRVPQILVCFQNKSAGQLSFYSLLMQCAGNFARIVSTLALVSDRIVLCSHLTAFIFNAAPLLQLIYYDVLHRDLRNIKPQARRYQRQIAEQLSFLLSSAAVCNEASTKSDVAPAARSAVRPLAPSTVNQKAVAAARVTEPELIETQHSGDDLPKKRFVRV